MKMGVFKAGWQSLACKGAIDRSRKHSVPSTMVSLRRLSPSELHPAPRITNYGCELSLKFLNIRLDNIQVSDEARHPHMVRNIHRMIVQSRPRLLNRA